MDESQDLIFEESEVLWAKIRGYPWWPAYVRDVHEADTPADYEYTVIFFGDNTNSRLGSSKLRKFPEHYAECYLKAKTNKKLKQSIQKAEQRLNENHQDVSYYENIRTNMIFKKKKAGPISQSRLSSSEKGEPVEPPGLVKHRTQQPLRIRRRRQEKKEEEIFQQSAQNISNEKASSDKKVHLETEMRRCRSEKLPNSSVRRASREPEPQQETPEQKTKKITKPKDHIESPIAQRDRYNMRSNHKNRDKSIQEEPNEEKQNSDQQSEKQQKQSPEKVIGDRSRKGRKGRPPKYDQAKITKPKLLKQITSRNSSSSEGQQNILEQRRPRKRILNHPIPKEVQPQEEGTLTQKETQKIRKTLPNRKDLTKLLFSIPITTGNIKQILDIGVSAALQQGAITKNIHLLLCTLKTTLLHKYFPDNNKHRKKYDKLIKEMKKVIIHEDEDQDQNQEGSDEENEKNAMQEEKSQERDQSQVEYLKKKQHNNKENKEDNRPKDATSKYENLNEIRKKANQKLQKMIKKAGLVDRARDYAIRIQSTFQVTADALGEQYRNVAYRRMRSMKTKLGELGEKSVGAHTILEYLEEIAEQYESEGLITKQSNGYDT